MPGGEDTGWLDINSSYSTKNMKEFTPRAHG